MMVEECSYHDFKLDDRYAWLGTLKCLLCGQEIQVRSTDNSVGVSVGMGLKMQGIIPSAFKPEVGPSRPIPPYLEDGVFPLNDTIAENSDKPDPVEEEGGCR